MVGFRADEATRRELERLSAVTGGTYRQADDAKSLTDSLQFLTQRAITRYEASGTDFAFADSPREAKFLGRGLCKTMVRTISGSMSDLPEKYFRLVVPEGHTAHVAVTSLPEIDLR